ncbi:MAG: hypothetical protein WCG27_02715 [Pseudomonadota bacterium]
MINQKHIKSTFALLFVCFAIFCNSACACAPDEYPVRSHFRKGYYKKNGTYYSETTVVSSCKKKRPNHDFAYERFKTLQPPGWPHRGESLSSWTERQKEDVLDAFATLPLYLMKGTVRGIYRLKRSKYPNNPGASLLESGAIVLYDDAFGPKLPRIVAHELAHFLYSGLSLEDKDSYEKATGWKYNYNIKDHKVYLEHRDIGFVSENAKNNPEEDFCVNVEFYLFDNAQLKKTTPTAFSWIEKQFGQNTNQQRDKK